MCSSSIAVLGRLESAVSFGSAVHQALVKSSVSRTLRPGDYYSFRKRELASLTGLRRYSVVLQSSRVEVSMGHLDDFETTSLNGGPLTHSI